MKAWYRYNRLRITGLLFILPALIYMLAMMGYPLVYNFALSVRNVNVMTFRGGKSVFVGLQQYVNLFQDEVFIEILLQTFEFTVACLVVQFTIGLILAVFLNGKFKAAGPVRGIILVAWMMPISVTGLLFKYMFITEGGIINYFIAALGLMGAEPIGWLIDPNVSLVAIIIANCWIGIPFNMLLLSTGMSNIKQEIYESASIDGASILQKFFKITIPLLKPAIMSVLMLGFIYTFKVFDLIYIMTKGGPLNSTEVLSTYAYKQSFTLFDFSKGAAASVVLFICLMFIGVFYLRLIRKEEAQ